MTPQVDKQRQADCDETYNSIVLHLAELWGLAQESPRARRHIHGLIVGMAKAFELLGKQPVA